jgi:hypothetical protein
MRSAVNLVLAILALVLAGCGGGGTAALQDPGGLGAIDYVDLPDPDRPVIVPVDEVPVGGGVLAEFTVGPDTFHVWVTEEDTIEQLVDIHEGRLAFTHLLGLIRAGTGENEHNLPWSWYLAPGVQLNIPGDPLTSFAGTLRQVEEMRDQLVSQDKYYVISSPGAALTALYDYR